MARHVAAGDEVHVLLMAEGATSRAATRDEADLGEIAALKAAAEAAGEALGAASLRFGGFEDNRMDGVDLLDVVKVVEAEITRVGPALVYTHHPYDLNVDHRLTCEAVLTACRPLPGSTVREVLAGEVLSATGWGPARPERSFCPTLFVGVEDHLDALRRALDAYAGEMRPFPHARSVEAVEAQARLRGAQVGLPAAEAFEVLRILRP
jgi:LmbE family N-acetylglucosaminyl deacetylase